MATTRKNGIRRARALYRDFGVPEADKIIAEVRSESISPSSGHVPRYKPFTGRNAARRNRAVERGLELNKDPMLNDTARAHRVADDLGYKSERAVFKIFTESTIPPK